MLLHSPRLDPFQLHLLWCSHIPVSSLSHSTGSIRQCPLSTLLCQFCVFYKAHPSHLLPGTNRVFLTVKSALAVYMSEQSCFRQTNGEHLSPLHALSRHVISRRAAHDRLRLAQRGGSARHGPAGAGRGAESRPPSVVLKPAISVSPCLAL